MPTPAALRVPAGNSIAVFAPNTIRLILQGLIEIGGLRRRRGGRFSPVARPASPRLILNTRVNNRGDPLAAPPGNSLRIQQWQKGGEDVNTLLNEWQLTKTLPTAEEAGIPPAPIQP